MALTNFLNYKTPRNKTCLTIKELVLNLTHVAPKRSNIALSYNKNKLKDKMSVIFYKIYILKYITLVYTIKILISLMIHHLNYYRKMDMHTDIHIFSRSGFRVEELYINKYQSSNLFYTRCRNKQN